MIGYYEYYTCITLCDYLLCDAHPYRYAYARASAYLPGHTCGARANEALTLRGYIHVFIYSMMCVLCGLCVLCVLCVCVCVCVCV